MVSNCCVVGYSNLVGKKKDLNFYCFPLADKEMDKKMDISCTYVGKIGILNLTREYAVNTSNHVVTYIT